MNRLVVDPFSRGLAQALLVLAIGMLVLVCILVDIFTLVKYFGSLDGSIREIALVFFQLLSQPFDNIFAQFLVAIGSIVPVVFATVCFVVDMTSNPPSASGTLNNVGKTSILMMLLGIVAGAVGLLLLSLFAVAGEQMAGGLDSLAKIKGALSGILAFQAIYFAQLLGLKPQ